MPRLNRPLGMLTGELALVALLSLGCASGERNETFGPSQLDISEDIAIIDADMGVDDTVDLMIELDDGGEAEQEPLLDTREADDQADHDAADCSVDNGGCDPNATCVPEPGGRSCVCHPGWMGDGEVCEDIATGLVGLRVELPCETDPIVDSCATIEESEAEATLSDSAEGSYDITLRFRGVVEQKTYFDEESADGYWREGGTPEIDTFNIYSLAISSPAQTYYLNGGTSETRNCWGIDYTQTVTVDSEATVVLQASDGGDEMQIINLDEEGQPIVVPDIEPAPDAFNGQFVQVDVVSIVPHSDDE